MDYDVVITSDAEQDLDEFVRYLLFEIRSEQAAKNLMDDFEETRKSLSRVAGYLQYCENPRLRELGYRRMNFLSHRYFMLYRIEENQVFVDNIFHELQDYENRIG